MYRTCYDVTDWRFHAFASYKRRILLCSHYVCPVVPMNVPCQHRHFIHFARILNAFRWNLQEVITRLPPTDELMTFWVKLYQGQGSKIRQKPRIDVEPVLPRSEWLYKFHMTQKWSAASTTHMLRRRRHHRARYLAHADCWLQSTDCPISVKFCVGSSFFHSI